MEDRIVEKDFGDLAVNMGPQHPSTHGVFRLKLYLQGYRNHGAFHENCTLMIAKKIINCINPKWLRIGGFWNPRGGIPIDVFCQSSKKPNNLEIPELKNFERKLFNR